MHINTHLLRKVFQNPQKFPQRPLKSLLSGKNFDYKTFSAYLILFYRQCHYCLWVWGFAFLLLLLGGSEQHWKVARVIFCRCSGTGLGLGCRRTKLSLASSEEEALEPPLLSAPWLIKHFLTY